MRNGPYCIAKRTVLQFESVFTAFLSDIFRLADSISLKFGDVKIGKKYLLSYILLPSRQRTDEGRQLIGHLLLLAVAWVVACAIAEVAGLGCEVEAIDILVAVLATFLLQLVEDGLLDAVLLLTEHRTGEDNDLRLGVDATHLSQELAVGLLVE